MRTYSGAELDQIVSRHHDKDIRLVLIFSVSMFIAGLVVGALL
jgi:hypothetical protein